MSSKPKASSRAISNSGFTTRASATCRSRVAWALFMRLGHVYRVRRRINGLRGQGFMMQGFPAEDRVDARSHEAAAIGMTMRMWRGAFAPDGHQPDTLDSPRMCLLVVRPCSRRRQPTSRAERRRHTGDGGRSARSGVGRASIGAGTGGQGSVGNQYACMKYLPSSIGSFQPAAWMSISSLRGRRA